MYLDWEYFSIVISLNKSEYFSHYYGCVSVGSFVTLIVANMK